MRVVLDTNILVSAILSPDGAASAVLSEAREGRIKAVTSATLLDELEIVFERFFPRSVASEIRAAIEELAHVVESVEVVPASRDPDDDHVLAAAVAVKARYIITRDRDLLSLVTHADIEIVEPGAFLALLRDRET
jgi:uncharacterized protein